MVLSGFFFWWYGAGYRQSWQIAGALLRRIADFFSLEILLKTLFSPWKDDLISARNASLGDQFRIWELNFVSRLVGFIVRLIVVAVAFLALDVATIVMALLLFAWGILPFLVIVLPILGIGVMWP